VAAQFCIGFREMVQEWFHEYPKYVSIMCLDEFESCVSQTSEDFLVSNGSCNSVHYMAMHMVRTQSVIPEYPGRRTQNRLLSGM